MVFVNLSYKYNFVGEKGGTSVNRILFILLLLLLLATGGVLWWQWNVYSNQGLDSNRKMYEANEVIHMSVMKQKIEIIHEIFNLPAGTYSLQNIKSTQVSCQEDEKKCEISSDKQLKTDGGLIQLTYSLQKPSSVAYVLDQWAMKLKDVKMTKTGVEITHYGKETGMWAAGAKLVGQTKKENIGYSVFEGHDGIFPLYYQNKVLKKVETNGVTVYGDGANHVITAATKYEAKLPLTFVISNKSKSFTSESLLIRPSAATMVQVLSKRYYNQNYPFTNEKETWLQGIIGAYVLDEKVDGKAKQLVAELSKQLSKEEQTEFSSLLKKNRGQDFSASYVDKLLSQATNMKADYFTRNKLLNRSLSPLYFMNDATWYDEKGKGSTVDSITMNSKRYYSLTQVTKYLGFRIEPISDTHIYLTDGKRSFRLYPGETTFLYNEKAYSIKGELLKEFNHQFYISEEYMRKIFNIFVREQDNELQLINLNSMV
jgi:hypothetical protein